MSEEKKEAEEQVDFPDNGDLSLSKHDSDRDVDSISGAIIEKIGDDIDNARSLRSWRPWVAVVISIAAIAGYALSLTMIIFPLCIVSWLPVCQEYGLRYLLYSAGMILLVSTVLTIAVARAVFSRSGSGGYDSYAPIKTIVSLMKD